MCVNRGEGGCEGLVEFCIYVFVFDCIPQSMRIALNEKAGWLVVSLVCCLVGMLVVWLVAWSVAWLMCWLFGWSVGCLLGLQLG